MELSVVLVNHNGAAVLPRSLGALARNTAAEEVEAIVVDSGSADGSWEGSDRHWERARALRFEENIGFCAGCNRGAEAATGRFVAFVNFDAEVEEGWDEPLRALLEDPSVAVATGVLLRPDGALLEAAGLEIAPNMATFGRLDGEPRGVLPAEPFEVEAASGALMMVRREEFLALGGFYEPLFMYGEEADYCLRVSGRIMLDPRSAIRHEQGHASGPLRSTTRLYWPSRNRLLLAARHLPRPRSRSRSRPLPPSTSSRSLRHGAPRLRRRSSVAGATACAGCAGERSAHAERAQGGGGRLVSFRAALREQQRLGRL